MERLLSSAAFLLAVASFTLVLLSRPAPVTDQGAQVAELEERIAQLEARPAVSSPVVAAKEERSPASWMLTARDVSREFRLSEQQKSALDEILARCETELAEAVKNEDLLWRDRLSKKARTKACSSFCDSLPKETKKKFAEWIDAPENVKHTAWFYREKGCCGGKKE